MSSQEDFNEVIHSELRLLDPEVRRDGDQVRKLLHPDFIEFGGSGRIWEAESIVKALALEINQLQVSPKNLKTVALSPDVVLLTYQTEDGDQNSLRSSIWVKNGSEGWVLRFHQGTRYAPLHENSKNEQIDFESEKNLAKSLFNSCWKLIDKPGRTTEEDAEMIHLAHASRWHWGNVGGIQERAIGEWQCARVHAILGNGRVALLHATLSAQLARSLPTPHFMKASAAEALAFAHFLLGEHQAASEYKEQAIKLLEGLKEKDAEHIRKQIAELPF